MEENNVDIINMEMEMFTSVTADISVIGFVERYAVVSLQPVRLHLRFPYRFTIHHTLRHNIP